MLELSGQYDESLHAYQIVMDVFQRLLELQPDNTDSKLEVGFAHNNLGKLKTSLGLLEEAEARYRRDLQIKQAAAETDPPNNLWRDYLASSHFWLGKLLLMRGDLEVLTNANPENAGWLKTQAYADLEKSWQAEVLGDQARATDYTENAWLITQQLSRQAPFDRDLRKLEIECLLTLGHNGSDYPSRHYACCI